MKVQVVTVFFVVYGYSHESPDIIYTHSGFVHRADIVREAKYERYPRKTKGELVLGLIMYYIISSWRRLVRSHSKVSLDLIPWASMELLSSVVANSPPTLNSTLHGTVLPL